MGRIWTYREGATVGRAFQEEGIIYIAERTDIQKTLKISISIELRAMNINLEGRWGP